MAKETDGCGGISSAEIDTGADRIDLAPRVGETAVSRMVRLAGHDAGALELEVR